MDNFSVLAGPLGYVDSTQEVECNSLHSLKNAFLLLNLQFCVPFYEVKRFSEKDCMEEFQK